MSSPQDNPPAIWEQLGKNPPPGPIDTDVIPVQAEAVRQLASGELAGADAEIVRFLVARIASWQRLYQKELVVLLREELEQEEED